MAVTFGSTTTGAISDFEAWLNGKELDLQSFSATSGPVTVATQLLVGTKTLGTSTGYELKVSGTVGASGGSYGGNIVATPVPEPETYAMMLAGLGALGFLARRRKS